MCISNTQNIRLLNAERLLIRTNMRIRINLCVRWAILPVAEVGNETAILVISGTGRVVCWRVGCGVSWRWCRSRGGRRRPAVGLAALSTVSSISSAILIKLIERKKAQKSQLSSDPRFQIQCKRGTTCITE